MVVRVSCIKMIFGGSILSHGEYSFTLIPGQIWEKTFLTSRLSLGSKSLYSLYLSPFFQNEDVALGFKMTLLLRWNPGRPSLPILALSIVKTSLCQHSDQMWGMRRCCFYTVTFLTKTTLLKLANSVSFPPAPKVVLARAEILGWKWLYLLCSHQSVYQVRGAFFPLKQLWGLC